MADEPSKAPLLQFEELEFPSPNGPRLVLVARPARRLVIGRQRLGALRTGHEGSLVDGALLRELATRRRQVDAVVFRACREQPKCWLFSEMLDEDETQELGYHLVRSQLRLYRRMLQAGVHGLFVVDLGERERSAIGMGNQRLAMELERNQKQADATPSELALARLDLWLVDHLAFWLPLDFERFVEERLANELANAERKTKQIDALLSTVPDDALA